MSDSPGDGGRRTGPALEAMYQLVRWLIPALQRFPRRRRFLLGDRIRTITLSALERLVEAAFTRRRHADAGVVACARHARGRSEERRTRSGRTDEVTSSLDTVVGAAIIELLKGLQASLGNTFVFISHDLSTVTSFADRIVVLYAGRIVEQGPTAEVFAPPHHPYTRLLLASVPELRQGWLEAVGRTAAAIRGIARAVETTAVGCSFRRRCPLAIEGVCDSERPPLRALPGGTSIPCHRELAELG